jgi:uncharacterized protein (TIGR03790 family)
MSRLKRQSFVALSLLWLLTSLAKADSNAGKRTPDQVLVVYNASSPISNSLADDYTKKRQVGNVLSVKCPDSALSRDKETISETDFKQSIEGPVRDYLAAHKHVDFIVLTKGIPIRVQRANNGGRPSVDSSLAALDYTALPHAQQINIRGSGATGWAYLNRYWQANEPFSHAKFGGYLVTRLDGYTEADAKALVVRALAAERGLVADGKILLDIQPSFGLGDKAIQPPRLPDKNIAQESPWNEFNADMRKAHDVLADRGIADELDLSEIFIGKRSHLLGYFSWGSNDAKYSTAAYQSLSFAPGSLCDTAVSTSARTFLPTTGGQSLLVDLIAHGLTCGKGYVDEPLLQAIASPSVALDRYTSGYTMAESFYAASHFVGWEDIVIGDPLCCPYSGRQARPKDASGVGNQN